MAKVLSDNTATALLDLIAKAGSFQVGPAGSPRDLGPKVVPDTETAESITADNYSYVNSLEFAPARSTPAGLLVDPKVEGMLQDYIAHTTLIEGETVCPTSDGSSAYALPYFACTAANSLAEPITLVKRAIKNYIYIDFSDTHVPKASGSSLDILAGLELYKWWNTLDAAILVAPADWSAFADPAGAGGDKRDNGYTLVCRPDKNTDANTKMLYLSLRDFNAKSADYATEAGNITGDHDDIPGVGDATGHDTHNKGLFWSLGGAYDGASLKCYGSSAGRGSTTGNRAVDFDNSILYDNSNTTTNIASINWATRALANAAGVTALSWIDAVNITATDSCTWKSSVSGKTLYLGDVTDPWGDIESRSTLWSQVITSQWQVTSNRTCDVYFGTPGMGAVKSFNILAQGAVDSIVFTYDGNFKLNGKKVTSKRLSDVSANEKVLVIET